MLCSIKLVLMLYYAILYKIAHRPYVLESYSISILFLSFSHPSIYLQSFCYCFTTYNQIGFSFFCLFMYAKKKKKKFQLLQ